MTEPVPTREMTLDEVMGRLYPEHTAVKQLAKIKGKLKIKSEFLSSRQCADHSGKWERGRCLQCEIEALTRTDGELVEAAEKALDFYSNFPDHLEVGEYAPYEEEVLTELRSALDKHAALNRRDK